MATNSAEDPIMKNLKNKLIQANMREIDIEILAHEVLINSNAFLRSRPPVVVVTGITHTGKSSLINALFREKRVREGLTSDTSDIITKIQFRSGMIIYDTPGAGGLRIDYENRTRGFLGLKQIEKDLDGTSLQTVIKIPIADAHNFDPVVGEPIVYKEFIDLEKPDLFIFVVSIKASLRGDDRKFFLEVAKLGCPVIVILNQIDGETPERVKSNLTVPKDCGELLTFSSLRSN